MAQTKGKVLLAMSGGVDSSVAASLLLEEGYEVVGCFMRLGNIGESLEPADSCNPLRIGHRGCCSVGDAKDAQSVAARLDIPFYVLNFKDAFGRIIDYFVDEYNNGRTPNPCVRCNDWLKFGRLLEYADSIDADYVATGHYARLTQHAGRPALLRGVDDSKDQSYVLFGLSQDVLRRILFPVGGFEKTEIRRRAEGLGLNVHDKPDSQEICFVPDDDYAGLIERRQPGSCQPGELTDVDGNVIGRHAGHQRFTVGQRRGIGVALGHPIYVLEKNSASNTVTVGQREALKSTGCEADQVNWAIDLPSEPITCRVKIRYNAPPVDGQVEAVGSDRIVVRFAEPQSAVAPGQAVVAYVDDRIIVGGWIASASG
jgi:tRNA-specific 2-thiouridylase